MCSMVLVLRQGSERLCLWFDLPSSSAVWFAPRWLERLERQGQVPDTHRFLRLVAKLGCGLAAPLQKDLRQAAEKIFAAAGGLRGAKRRSGAEAGQAASVGFPRGRGWDTLAHVTQLHQLHLVEVHDLSC